MRGIMTPEELQARVLFRDALMLIIDKPAGLAVHAGPGGGANLEQWFEHLRFGIRPTPGLAHRLDRDTSGCLVLGRHRKALKKLGALFSEGRVEKTYWAVTAGAPQDAEGVIDLPLTKINRKTGWKMVVDPKGQPARTEYEVLGHAGGLAWLELRPRTGRTHQIRVHCAALGCPVLGDPVYGLSEGAKCSVPLHLHARAISLPLYPGKPPIAAQAPVPRHMLDSLIACGFIGD